MRFLVSIAAFLLLVATPVHSVGIPTECLAKVSSLGVCLGLNWQFCSSCMNAVSRNNFDSACDAVEHFECEIGGCCVCSEQELTRCIEEESGEDCGDIDCGNFGGFEVDNNSTDPTAAPCGFCPGGYGIQNSDAVFGEIDLINGTLTCGQVQESLDKIPGGDLCKASQDLVVADGYPSQCGYCVIPAEGTESCTLCAGGSLPTKSADTVVNSENKTCGELQYDALKLSNSDETCAGLHVIGADSCGCALPTSHTSRLDGSVIIDMAVVAAGVVLSFVI